MRTKTPRKRTNEDGQDAAQLARIIDQALGDHPRDIVGLLLAATKASEWADFLFSSIENQLADGSPAAIENIQQIADLGRHMAQDHANTMSCAHHNMVCAMRKAGFYLGAHHG